VALRHFEHLSNEETAHVLGIKPSAARTRHVRALKRLHEVLQRSPGCFDKNRE
jgi:DNA-directed RNA polymerase specialized sigma24 family protein